MFEILNIYHICLLLAVMNGKIVQNFFLHNFVLPVREQEDNSICTEQKVNPNLNDINYFMITFSFPCT